MIVTECKHCCFSNSNHCKAGQLTCIKNDELVAPGYCRMFRTNKWAEKQNKDRLIDTALSEKFKCDLIIIFDSNRFDNIDYLQRSLTSNLIYYNQIKIVNISLKSKMNSRILTMLHEYPEKLQQKISLEQLTNIDIIRNEQSTLRYIINRTNAPFFVVLYTGQKIIDTFKIDEYINNPNHRSIYTSFYEYDFETCFEDNQAGIYIRRPYLFLSKNSKNSFNETLITENLETPIQLYYIMDEVIER